MHACGVVKRRAVVGDAQERGLRPGLQADAYRGTAIAQGIVNQVAERLLDQGRIRFDPARRLSGQVCVGPEVPALRRRALGPMCHDLPRQRRQIQRGPLDQRRIALRPRQQQQLAHQVRGPHGGGMQFGEDFAVGRRLRRPMVTLHQVLGQQLDPRRGRAQLMGGIGDETAFVGYGLGQAREQVVQALDQAAKFLRHVPDRDGRQVVDAARGHGGDELTRGCQTPADAQEQQGNKDESDARGRQENG